jgi:hypothetical protein
MARPAVSFKFILAKPIATDAAPLPRKRSPSYCGDGFHLSRAVRLTPVPVTRRDAAIPPPLDVAPERALPGSSDRLCPDSDHHRKADKMKSSDPADCQGRRRGHFDPRTGGLGNSCKVILMSPSLPPTGIANPCSSDRLRYRAHGSHRGTHFQ